MESQSPGGSADDFPVLLLLDGQPPISTRRPHLAELDLQLSQSREGFADDFHDKNLVVKGKGLALSQSPEGSAADFHFFFLSVTLTVEEPMSQSPEGSAADFHVIATASRSIVMSQSPKGSADDFHLKMELNGLGLTGECLNPAKGPPTISTPVVSGTPGATLPIVSIPRRGRRRFNREALRHLKFPTDGASISRRVR